MTKPSRIHKCVGGQYVDVKRLEMVFQPEIYSSGRCSIRVKLFGASELFDISVSAEVLASDVGLSYPKSFKDTGEKTEWHDTFLWEPLIKSHEELIKAWKAHA